MKKSLLFVAALLLAAVAAVYVSERRVTFAGLADSPFVWFVAVKYEPQHHECSLVLGAGCMCCGVNRN